MISSLEKLKYCVDLKKMRDSLNEDCTDSITLIDHLIIDLVGEINTQALSEQLIPIRNSKPSVTPPSAVPAPSPCDSHYILLTPHEIQSGHNRQMSAEKLILKLPDNHDGRNSWLLNYGTGEVAAGLRKNRPAGEIKWDWGTQAAKTVGNP